MSFDRLGAIGFGQRFPELVFNNQESGIMISKAMLLSAISAAIALSGCATNPDKIAAVSISSLGYEQHNCKQIAAELDRVNLRSSELYGKLKKTADDDNAQMAVGMLLLWPTLFFLEGGDGPDAAEYARIKGERDALEKVAIQKECGIKLQRPELVQTKEAKSGETQPADANVQVETTKIAFNEKKESSPAEPLPKTGSVDTKSAKFVMNEKQSTVLGTTEPEIRTGRYSYTVEQLAKADGCNPTKWAELISKQGSSEFYKVTCDGAEPFVYLCQHQVCKKALN